jgi:hypothetical protein
VAEGVVSAKSVIYALLRLSNDLNAIKRGKVGRRVGRRIVGKLTGRAMGRVFR